MPCGTALARLAELSVLCSVLCALCSVLCALCSVLCALCSAALCSVLPAPGPAGRTGGASSQARTGRLASAQENTAGRWCPAGPVRRRTCACGFLWAGVVMTIRPMPRRHGRAGRWPGRYRRQKRPPTETTKGAPGGAPFVFGPLRVSGRFGLFRGHPAFALFARQCNRRAYALGDEFHQTFDHPFIGVDPGAGTAPRVRRASAPSGRSVRGRCRISCHRQSHHRAPPAPQAANSLRARWPCS